MIITFVLYIIWRQNTTRFDMVSKWVLCFALQSIGVTMILMRGFIPDFLSIVLSNVLLVLGSVLFYFGIASFIKTDIKKKYYYAFVGIIFVIYTYFGLLEPELRIRATVFSLMISFINYRCAKILYKSNDNGMKKNYRLTGSLVFLISLIYFLMAVYYMVGTTGSNYFKVGSVIALMTFLVQMILVFITFSILMMINHKLVLILEEESQEREKLLEDFKYLATVDGVTKLWNRKTIEEKLTEEFDRSQRYRCKMSVILLDVDHFKKINDNFGHATGDLVLEKISEILKHTLRKTDFIGRWGGEEFIVVCVETDQRSAWKVAEKLRKAVAEYEFDLKTQVSISLGTATLKREEVIEDILKRADDNMYRSKEAGRNRTSPDISSEEKYYKKLENDFEICDLKV